MPVPYRFWVVVVDDTPVLPENPLTLDEAVELFKTEVNGLGEDEDTKVEIRQCTSDDLEWAGISVDEAADRG